MLIILGRPALHPEKQFREKDISIIAKKKNSGYVAKDCMNGNKGSCISITCSPKVDPGVSDLIIEKLSFALRTRPR
jgi:hypothetical protein